MISKFSFTVFLVSHIMIVFTVWVTHVCCYCREKRSTMAEIVEQVQEREAANVN